MLDWMETDGKHLEYPCLTIRQSLRGMALEVGRSMERETLKSGMGFDEIINLLDEHFRKDRDSERLDKALNTSRQDGKRRRR